MDQDLDSRFGFVELLFHGKAQHVQIPPPEVAGDGEKVGVPEERDEWDQEPS
jgi:hypothetical protein